MSETLKKKSVTSRVVAVHCAKVKYDDETLGRKGKEGGGGRGGLS